MVYEDAKSASPEEAKHEKTGNIRRLTLTVGAVIHWSSGDGSDKESEKDRDHCRYCHV